VRLSAVSKVYRDRDVETRVLESATLELARGDTASLAGASGSGKSTLLALIAGLTRPSSGTIAIDGQDVTTMDDAGRARLRAEKIGFVLQSGNLIPFLTGAENVELAMHLGRGRPRPARARELLGELGLAHRADHLPRQMSGGEAQRVSVAVALANKPELLLADEVTGELDSESADQVMTAIFEARRDRGLTVLFVTHSRELAARAGSRLRLVDGGVTAA
jgi:putative ABC transport system ATP-binding protein